MKTYKNDNKDNKHSNPESESVGLHSSTSPPGNSAGDLLRWLGDLQRSGIKRSRIESPGIYWY